MVKHITRTAKLLLLISALVLFCGLIWLRQAERSLDWAKPSILRAMAPTNGAYRLDFDKASIDWRDWSQFGLLRITRITTTGPDGKIFASFPELFISLDPLGFLPARHWVHRLLLKHPKLLLTRGEDAVLRLGVAGETPSVPLANLLAPLTPASSTEKPTQTLSEILENLPFRALEMEHAEISFIDTQNKTTLQSTNTNLRLSHRAGLLEGTLDIPFQFNKTHGRITADVTPSRTQATTQLNATITRLPTQLGTVLGLYPPTLIPHGLIRAELQLTLDENAIPQRGKVQVASKKIKIAAPKWFESPLSLSDVKADLTISNQGNSMLLSNATMTLPDTTLTATARATKGATGWGIKATGETTPLAMEQLRYYWPLPLAPASRNWVIQSIPSGQAERAHITLNLTPASMAAPTLPSEALDATVHARNLTVHYIDGFPPIEGVTGEVHFTGTQIEATLAEGHFLKGGLVHAGSTVRFPDLHAAGTPMEVALTLTAPAGDAATILTHPIFAFDDALTLAPETLTGSITSTLDLAFHAFSSETNPAHTTDAASQGPDFSQVRYRIDGKLQDISQKALADTFDLSAINGTIHADNEGMDFKGTAALQGAQEGITLIATQKTGQDVALTAQGRLHRSQFSLLHLPNDTHFGKGSMEVDAQMWIKKDAVDIQKFRLNLEDMALHIPELSWEKPRHQKANLTIMPSKRRGQYNLSLRANDLNIPKATLTLDASLTPTRIDLPSVTTNRNDFSLYYEKQKDGFDITLTGKRLDASTAYAQTGDGLLADFPPISLNLALEELILTPAAPIRNIRGKLYCRKRCENADFSAKSGEANITASIARPNNQRTLTIAADNAGDFLRALDMTDRVFDGKLSFTGTYDDLQTPAPLKGHTHLTHYTLKNSQILGRILSIGSLTGLANVLTGSGIAFDQMDADVTALAGKIQVHEGRTSGTALGLTVKGTIDTTQSTVDLTGVVVPAYFFNSLLGKIPLIGRIAGGDGEGLVAINYSLHGPNSDPEIFVNPLSILTPGFLRGIWRSNSADSQSESQSKTP